MKDRSKGYSAAPWLNWSTRPSVLVIGAAVTLAGIAISGITIYRNLIFSESNLAISAESTLLPPASETSNTNNICFQPDLGLSPDSSDLDTAAITGKIGTPQQLLALKFSELEKKVISFGEQSLVGEEYSISQETNNRIQTIKSFRENKQQGTEKYAAGQYQEALIKFKAARESYRNSPENLIYLNNSLASQASKSYVLAVAAPLNNSPMAGSGIQPAMGILRGVAHAQRRHQQRRWNTGHSAENIDSE